MHEITQEEITRRVSATDYSEALTITAYAGIVNAACDATLKHEFRAVVAFPQHLGVLADRLKDSGVLAQIPVGFPCGGVTTKVKCTEAKEGLERGATDLDMVMNIAAFHAGEFKKVSEDVGEVMKVAKPYGVPFKVIIEVGTLTDDQIVTASKLVVDCGADFIKTCPGFGSGRSTVHIIGIKASGGVSSIEDGVALMRAGATVVALRKFLVDQLESLD